MPSPAILDFLASDTLQPWLMDHLPWLVPAAIVVLGLGIFGIPDLLRFSLKRIWAISGVCYQESIRRRVLWIIPLAILGLVIVVQLQQPIDEQDAIRETTKFCLFATGMVVVISTIILACTNLPREIENRVIFTVVSKPTTRLEIVLGKITGFARVSATILLIMGLFSYGYLHLRAWSLERDLRERLQLNAVENISRPTFQHYVDAGLLNAKQLANPDAMNVYGQAPEGGVRRYPTSDGMILVPFHLPADMLATSASDAADQMQGKGIPGMWINVRVGFDPTPPPPPSKTGRAVPGGPPKVNVAVLDQNANNILTSELKGIPAQIPNADGSQAITVVVPAASAALLSKYPFIFISVTSAGGDGKMWIAEDSVHPAENPPVTLSVPVTSMDKPETVLPSDPLDPAKPGHFVFTGREGVIGQQVKGDPAIPFSTGGTLHGGTTYYIEYTWEMPGGESTPDECFAVTTDNATNTNKIIFNAPAAPAAAKGMRVYAGTTRDNMVYHGSLASVSSKGLNAYSIESIETNSAAPAPPSILSPAPKPTSAAAYECAPQVCVFMYDGLPIEHGSGGTIPIEFRVGVEKSGDIRDQDVLTDSTLTVINSKTGKASPPILVQPENNRPFYASVPADAVEGGSFAVVVRCLSADQWINVKRTSLSIVRAEDSFAMNLLKSTLVLWLLSVLVTTISVFCSTFLSWPIAVVLTLVMLLGRWGVNQLGDAATAGIGRQIATDFKIDNITQAQVFAGTVEDLNKALKAVATVLPDIERFAATENIDRGISIPNQTLVNAAGVLLLFGLPLTVLSYIFLKNKEVAP